MAAARWECNHIRLLQQSFPRQPHSILHLLTLPLAGLTSSIVLTQPTPPFRTLRDAWQVRETSKQLFEFCRLELPLALVDAGLDLSRLWDAGIIVTKINMATLLSHTPVPLWAWIVIIASGSIILLAMSATLWWCCTRPNWRREATLPNPVLAPTRKVTIRRGRLVDSSRRVSLTGSKFGVGQFKTLEEKDQETARSRSPFMWWLSNVQDRSQSRQSQRSDQPQMEDMTTSMLRRPEPAFHGHHEHKESMASDYSLPSIINGKELAEDACRYDGSQRSPTSPTSPTSPRNSIGYVNFSRAFSPLNQSTVMSPNTSKVLSQIIETSPRHSMDSKPESTISVTELPQTPTFPLLPEKAAMPLRSSHSVPRHITRTPSVHEVDSRFSFTTDTSVSLSSPPQPARSTRSLRSVPSERDTRQALRSNEHNASSYATRPSRTRSVPDMTQPPPYQKSRPHPQNMNTSRPQNAPSVWGSQRSNERIREMNKRYSNDHEESTERLREMTTRYSNERSRPAVSDRYSIDQQRPSVSDRYSGDQQRPSSKTHSVGYWEQRPDLVPVRTPSKKGNVLRKKSLKRAEVVSWVGS